MDTTLSIEQLRSFVEIAESGSFTQAAENLYRTQPAVSMQIKRLEKQLGTQLIARDGRQTTVTEAGHILLNYARRILDLNAQAFSKLTVVQTEGSVRIGILEEVTKGPLVDLLTKFGRLCTKIRLELVVGCSWELTEMIHENKLGLAVANTSYTHLPVTPLWKERYVWAMNRDVERHREDPLPLVLDHPLAAPCIMREQALNKWDAEGRAWKVVFSSASLAATNAAIGAGLGVGIISEGELTPDLVALGAKDGLTDIVDAPIGLLRSPEANSEADDCLFDFLVSNLRSEPVAEPLPA